MPEAITSSQSPLTAKRILLAPLHWGLGHVTRCIPLIQALEQAGMELWLASDGGALHLLKAEFPHLPCLSLPGYRIRYDTSNMVWNMARQLPKILYAIRAEQWATEKIVQRYGIQGIISDNRYGCFSRYTNNVLLTHQLNLRVPNPMLEWLANRLLRKALQKFQAVWIPDAADHDGLSGSLGHPATGIDHPAYIGLLSRAMIQSSPKEYDVAVILSGPEPQRTYLEQALLEQAMALPYSFIFIQGKTQSKTHHYVADHIEVVSYLTAAALNRVVAASDVLVCRSGYSTLMDLAATGKRAVLIPTPGQTEQEYLAHRLASMGAFVVQEQSQLNLATALKAAVEQRGLSSAQWPINTFQAHLTQWLQQL